MAGWNLKYSYRKLPPVMYQNASAEPLVSPKLVAFNISLAKELGLNPESHSDSDWAEVLSGSSFGSLSQELFVKVEDKGANEPSFSNENTVSNEHTGPQPLAMAYAGHQFGHFTILGDGRAILLGEQTTPLGKTYDIHLKGSGRTPYSRRGDGKAALAPMLREYLISEAMFALGIPTTRSLAVIATGEMVERETRLPGAVLCRVASSHIRVGTFEFAALHGAECVKQLADYTIERHYPELLSTENRYLGLLVSVIDRQAKLISSWLSVGFIHGVMNTDNMSISGETIDYGPCAFMDFYNPNQVYSFIDRQSRYAYQNQPSIALWNLERLAETLIPLLDKHPDDAIEKAKEALSEFAKKFQVYWSEKMTSKLGLNAQINAHQELVHSFLNLLEKFRPDFTTTFRGLSEHKLPSNSFFESDEFLQWHKIYLEQRKAGGVPDDLIRERMRLHNPRVIPRNHIVQRALDAAESAGDFSLFEKLLKAVSSPFEDAASADEFSLPPLPTEEIENTFCGT